MSAFEDAVIQRIKRLEREVERLQRWERPIGGEGGVTDHGWLTGLLDNDHPQYLLTTGKASDSDKLDGVDSTGYVNTSSSQTVDGVKSFIKNILSNSILPLLPETYDIGSDTYRYRKGYFSELSSLIFSKENIVVLDGQFLVTKMAGTLPATVTATDLEIDFGCAMFSGDFVLFRSEGQMEYMQVGSIVSGTTYQVTRNLDGSGANVWPEGVPFAVLGSAGEGWIELNALDKRRISIWAQGSAYNNSLEIARYGEITGWQNAGFSGVGLAFGDFANNKYFVSTDVDGMMAAGLSLKIGSGEKDVDLTGVQIDDTEIVGQADGVDQVVIGVDGKLKAGGGDIVLGENGIILNAPSGSDAYDSKKSLNFMMMDTNTLVGYLSGYKGGNNEAYANILRMWANGSSPNYRSTLKFTTYNGDASNQKISNIAMESTSTYTNIDFTADNSRAIGNFNVVNGGLHVGSTTDPGDNNLVVDGTIKDGNGVEYLKTTGKAADSDKLDGVDITAFKGLDSLTDPGADRVLFWDESANTLKWLTLGDGLTITDTTILSAPVRYAVKAYRSASFSISGPGTITTIPLDAEEYDTHSQHDNTTNSSRLTCKKAGLYVVTGMITFNATSLSAWNMVIRKNNTTDLIVESTTASSGGVYVAATVIVPLAVNDYIEMRGWHGLSTNVSLVVTNNYNVQLSMARISE